MPGRPLKRSAGSSDDGQASRDIPAKVKLPRLDRGQDFSSVVKNRLQSYTRTGQACDRCKVRKIRCDALPEGCSHCTSQNIECVVTDRVTGRTERRGYLQEVEREKEDALSHIRSLEKLLSETGVEVQPWQWSPVSQCPPGITLDSNDNIVQDPKFKDNWTRRGSVWVKSHASNASKTFSPFFPRNLLQSRLDNHLGVEGDSEPTSSIKGTRLSILGATVDLASYKGNDMDEPPPDAEVSAPLYNKSVHALLQSIMNVNPPEAEEMPSRDDAFMYSDWYFMTLANFLPILHKPTFTTLLTKVYDDPSFQPTVPESVCVHMVFAAMYFQIGARNSQNIEHRISCNNLSNKHYHFALSKFFELTCLRNLESVQAMAFIASHTRAFPKPGCAAILVNLALERALELNLHRESRKDHEENNLNHEMRKRVWWTILTVYVAVVGRRGRPMPITVQDFDVGFPSPIADELLSEAGIDTSREVQCSYQVGIAGFKVIPIFMEMYSNLYCVRRDPQQYVSLVEALEKQIHDWHEELPNHLQLDQPEHTDAQHMSALYTRSFLLEFRLCLRHPSVAMTNDKEMMAENTRICEEVSREMLRIQRQIQRLRSLDTTWYQISVYIAAVFTMLAAHWERRFETTPEAIAQLREDMDGWVSIVTEAGSLMDPGQSIGTEVKIIIDRTIAWIESDMRNKSVSTQDRKPSGSDATPVLKQESQGQTPNLPVFQAPAAMPNGTSQHDIPPKGYFENGNMNGQTSYPQLAYTGQGQENIPPASFNTETAMYYHPSAQAVAAAAVPNVSASHANPIVAYASAAQQVNPSASDMLWQRGGNTWHNWTNAITNSQDQYASSALLTLGGGPREAMAGTGVPEVSAAGSTNDLNGMTGQWPLMLFPSAPSGS